MAFLWLWLAPPLAHRAHLWQSPYPRSWVIMTFHSTLSILLLPRKFLYLESCLKPSVLFAFFPSPTHTISFENRRENVISHFNRPAKWITRSQQMTTRVIILQAAEAHRNKAVSLGVWRCVAYDTVPFHVYCWSFKFTLSYKPSLNDLLSSGLVLPFPLQVGFVSSALHCEEDALVGGGMM